MGRLKHQDVANSAWALAVVQGSDEVMACIVKSPCLADPSGFKAPELSNVTWSFALSSIGGGLRQLPTLLHAAAAKCSELEPQHLANITWAFATASMPVDSTENRSNYDFKIGSSPPLEHSLHEPLHAITDEA